MPLSRRVFLGAPAIMLTGPAWAQDLPVLADYERQSGGRIGVHAENLKSGKKIAWRAGERFVMCSTFKASLVACTLSRVDRGKEDLARSISYSADDLQDFYAPVAKQNLSKGHMTVGEMCEAAVELSDNACANLLLASMGGPAALTDFWRATGDDVSRLDHNEPVLNRSRPGDPHDTTTPTAMAGNLRRFLLGKVLSPEIADQVAELDDRLSDWRKSLAGWVAPRLANRRQDRKQRRRCRRRHRDAVAGAGHADCRLCLYAGRHPVGAPVGKHLQGYRPRRGATPGLTAPARR